MIWSGNLERVPNAANGAEVRPVEAGTGTLKDATSEAIRDWVTNVENTHTSLVPLLVSPNDGA